MDEKDQQIAHFRIVARNLKLAEFRPNQQFAMDRHFALERAGREEMDEKD
jgi:hypothetical protein